MNRRLAFLVVAGAILAATASPHEKAARVGPGRDARVLVLSTMLAEEGLGEWGFAALVEVEGHRILFDTGLGEDVVLRNARALNVDLATVPDVVISHNHRDHTGGLVTLRREYARASPSVLAVVGGLHLFQKDDASLDWTADRLRALGVQNLIGAHCTGLEAVYRIRARAGLDRAHCVVGAAGASFSLAKGIDPLALAR